MLWKSQLYWTLRRSRREVLWWLSPHLPWSVSLLLPAYVCTYISLQLSRHSFRANVCSDSLCQRSTVRAHRHRSEGTEGNTIVGREGEASTVIIPTIHETSFGGLIIRVAQRVQSHSVTLVPGPLNSCLVPRSRMDGVLPARPLFTVLMLTKRLCELSSRRNLIQ
jgi:hypothetical protein